MLTPDEVQKMWWLLVFTPNKEEYESDPPYEDIRYIAQDSDGLWYGYTAKPRCSNGVWSLGSTDVNDGADHRLFSVHKLHDGYDEHCYEVPR